MLPLVSSPNIYAIQDLGDSRSRLRRLRLDLPGRGTENRLQTSPGDITSYSVCRGPFSELLASFERWKWGVNAVAGCFIPNCPEGQVLTDGLGPQPPIAWAAGP